MITNFGSTNKFKKEMAPPKRKNVQVVVRTRPMSEVERGQKNKSVVNCDSVAKVITLKAATHQNDKHNQPRQFGAFDKVYGPETTQIHVYNEVVAPLMKQVIDGYNCTVFAYGQTGSGKTYTMEGRHDESGEYTWDTDPTSGIIPRALHQIFTELSADDIDFTVRASYVELYNEQIYDLLSLSETSQGDFLRIFEDKTKGVSIVGAEEVVVRTRDEVYELLRRGAEKRRTAATLMNITSSRSHSVFTVTVMIREPGLVNGEELLRQGKLNLVDLAGSENIGRSGATDKRAREAGNINTSLLALGRVINALTMNAPHIPYRESKLTRILQDSLGGKTITTIIATLSPASSNYEESISTLEYAQRAKNIKNNPEVNQKITRRGLLKEYNEEIERLRRDLLAAREKHGIYLDKENYDTMLETIEEKSARVEELEIQLSGQLHRLKLLVEDFAIMDEHYHKVYEKCLAAVAKLERRKLEVENLNKDLAATKDNLQASNRALSLSENAFVRLRSQAYHFQSNCQTFYEDLGTLHSRVDALKQLCAANDQGLGIFASAQNSEMDQGKQLLNKYADATMGQMDKMKGFAAEIENTTSASAQYIQMCQGLEKRADDFRAAFERSMANLQADTAKFLSNCHEQLKRQASEIHSQSQKLVQTARSTEGLAEEQKQFTAAACAQLSATLDKAKMDTDEFAHGQYRKYQSTGATPLRRYTNSFLEDLVDIEPAQTLVAQQHQLLTPHRNSFYRTRDSILDTSDFGNALVSPATLKQNLPSQAALETLDEDTGVESESSMREKRKAK